MKKQFVCIFFILLSFFYLSCGEAQKREKKQNNAQTTQDLGTSGNIGAAQSDDRTPPHAANGQIPAKVYRVLEYVREHGEAMPGYVGGRNFQNREGRLAKKDGAGRKLKYQEWDVNPKRGGVNRGAERLVTGSDNRAWFTNDHYRNFVEVK